MSVEHLARQHVERQRSETGTVDAELAFRSGFQAASEVPVPMLLWCPMCCERHVDKGRFETHPHYTHACQSCGHVWRPAIVPTVGVQFLPGFRDG